MMTIRSPDLTSRIAFAIVLHGPFDLPWAFSVSPLLRASPARVSTNRSLARPGLGYQDVHRPGVGILGEQHAVQRQLLPVVQPGFGEQRGTGNPLAPPGSAEGAAGWRDIPRENSEEMRRFLLDFFLKIR